MKRALLLCVATLWIAACGSHDDLGFGRVTLRVADAPVDEASRVVVSFTGVELRHEWGGSADFDFGSRKNVNLLALTGGDSEALLDDDVVRAGDYDWVRLKVDEDRSYIEINGERRSLQILHDDESRLKLEHGFHVNAGENNRFTIDFDLRKSVYFDGSQYRLRPALRMVRNSDAGTISGTVAAALLDAESCTGAAAVYVYGGDVTPDDVGGSGANPLTSARVWRQTEGGTGSYVAGFVPAGLHTVAFTCQAGNDSPNGNEDILFADTATVSVRASEEVVHNF